MVLGQVGPPTETVTPLKIDCYGFFVCWFQEKEKNPTQN